MCGPRDFRLRSDKTEHPVIGVIPGKIITEHLRATLPVVDGVVGIDSCG